MVYRTQKNPRVKFYCRPGVKRYLPLFLLPSKSKTYLNLVVKVVGKLVVVNTKFLSLQQYIEK